MSLVSSLFLQFRIFGEAEPRVSGMGSVAFCTRVAIPLIGAHHRSSHSKPCLVDDFLLHCIQASPVLFLWEHLVASRLALVLSYDASLKSWKNTRTVRKDEGVASSRVTACCQAVAPASTKNVCFGAIFI